VVEGVLVALDVGTSKVCALIGEIGRDGRLTVIGHGTVPSAGLKRGAVVNIEQTVRSIRDAVEQDRIPASEAKEEIERRIADLVSTIVE